MLVKVLYLVLKLNLYEEILTPEQFDYRYDDIRLQ
jgi:hypothetical protein